jgi:hypothetical protein
MLRSVRSLFGYGIRATDGEIGSVHDLFFDDDTWTVRYLVAETGGWLLSRKVLLSPAALGRPDWDARILPVHLSKEQVKNSPDIDADKPVSRRQQEELHKYYAWPPYWPMSGGTPIPPPHPIIPEVEEEKRSVAEGERVGEGEKGTNLRSAREVIHYHIEASDGEIGSAEDFIVDDGTWAIRYVIADTRDWLPGKRALFSPDWITAIRWAEGKIFVDISRHAVRSAPELDPEAPISRDYEILLYDYYGRPKYWR